MENPDLSLIQKIVQAFKSRPGACKCQGIIRFTDVKELEIIAKVRLVKARTVRSHIRYKCHVEQYGYYSNEPYADISFVVEAEKHKKAFAGSFDSKQIHFQKRWVICLFYL